jgi:hypothetical protein
MISSELAIVFLSLCPSWLEIVNHDGHNEKQRKTPFIKHPHLKFNHTNPSDLWLRRELPPPRGRLGLRRFAPGVRPGFPLSRE